MRDIIVGCGHMGASLAMNLQLRGHDVTIIDKDKEAFKKLPPDFSGVKVVGYGIDRKILEALRIDQVDALVACTNDDETNALLARIVKNQYRVPQVIALLYDPRKADIYQSFGIQTISPVSWGIQRVTELLSYNQLDTVWSPDNGQVEIIRVETPPLLIGHTVKELMSMGEIMIVTISRGNQSIIPVSGTILQAHDVLYIAVVMTAKNKLKTMLGLR